VEGSLAAHSCKRLQETFSIEEILMRTKARHTARVAAALSSFLLVPVAIGAGTEAGPPPGTLATATFHSATLGEDVAYNVYLPAGYESTAKRYPVLYLLHGRGDSMSAWTQMKSKLDELIADAAIPPTIAIMPDAPWSSRASYYVDSSYRGADPGRPVETAFTTDLLAHVDATYRTIASRDGRVVGGYSMGGYGALRYSLAHPDLFAASIVLSPAVYFPLPPADSSTREFGAFGSGGALFVDSIYRKLNYPAEFPRFSAKSLQSHMFIAVGDDEYQNPGDYTHDLDFEAHVLYKQALRVPNLSAELRVLNGGHDWDVWGPAFEAGAKYAFQFVGRPDVSVMKATLVGTAGEDREGGVAVDSAGNVYEALAAEGSVDGQPNAGLKDVVLIKYDPAGTKLWTREFGTSGTDRAYGLQLDPQGHPVVVGYTNRDLDGGHAGNTSDDIFVAKYDPNGAREWLTQVGTTAADRGYALAIDAAGSIYVGGYTKGNLAATNAGDKDVYLLALASTGGAPLWIRQFGTAGEDKGLAVATGGGHVYLAGMATDTIGTPLAGTTPGGLDGFLAHFDSSGTRTWTAQVGTTADDQLWGVAADASGNATVAGYSAGSLFGPLAGDKDIVVARFDPTGAAALRDQLGTIGNDKGASVALDGAGNTYVSGFSDGNLETNIGKFDAVLVKYAPGLTREWARQFGTTEDDGADAFAEGNVFLATHGTRIWASGFTMGSTATQAQAGSGDVFLTSFDAQGVNG
jgi:enterochelin esterase-like enzyme